MSNFIKLLYLSRQRPIIRFVPNIFCTVVSLQITAQSLEDTIVAFWGSQLKKMYFICMTFRAEQGWIVKHPSYKGPAVEALVHIHV